MSDDRSPPKKHDAAALAPAGSAELDERREPPVVARLVVEIRSDGSRTIARGAIEDLTVGQQVSIEAHGTTPASLAMSLVGSLLRVPALGRLALRALLPSSSRRR